MEQVDFENVLLKIQLQHQRNESFPAVARGGERRGKDSIIFMRSCDDKTIA